MEELRVAPGPACARGESVRVRFDGRAIPAFEGDTLGAALHAAGERALMRSIKYHRPRGLFCNAGACASCLVRVDGVPNVRACVTPVRDGMVVESQNALPNAKHDLLAVTDKVFRRDFDHHEFMARATVLRAPFHAIVRRMAGFGELPRQAGTSSPHTPLRPPVQRRDVDVLVVGAGPAGLAAAVHAAEGAASVLLVDEGDRPGGSLLLAGEAGVAHARELSSRFHDAGGEALARSVAFGCYLTDGLADPIAPPGVIGVLTPERLVEVRPKTLVVATGFHETPPLVPGNDLPGVMGARAALILLHRHGVLAGKRVLATADKPLARRACEDLRAAGAEVVGLLGSGELERARLVAIRGGLCVSEVALEVDGSIRTERVDCVVSAGDETPRVELLQQAGVPLAWTSAGMSVAAHADGATSVPGVYAAGDLLGLADASEHVERGARVGEAAAKRARGVPS